MTKTSWIESDVEEQGSKKISLDNSLKIEKFIGKFSKNFKDKMPMKTNNVELLNDPFQVSVINKFLADEKIIPKLVEEMQQIDWRKKQMDLYEFYQSADLYHVTCPFLNSFYNFITTDVKTWIESLTGMKFQKASVSCSMYNCSNFLLSHDDLLSDRLIAYVFYLSPWENAKCWNESMGGALEIFKRDIDGQPEFPPVRKIFPSNNQFAFFKVEKISHHQVGEVLSKDYPRLTIHGWFHGYKNNVDYDSEAIKIKKPNVPLFRSPNDVSFKYHNLINQNYLKDSIKIEIQKQIEQNSEAGLSAFLKEDFLEALQRDLLDENLRWTVKGPANQQNYEILDLKTLQKKSLKSLVDAVASKQFFKLLFEYTELDLYGKNAKNPKCSVELQRWQGGHYALINDPSTYNEATLDLILTIGSNESVGVITYLVPDKQDDDSDSEIEDSLLTIYPQNNFLNLVYRSGGTAKFTKYCYKSAIMESDYNYILFCSYKE